MVICIKILYFYFFFESCEGKLILYLANILKWGEKIVRKKI